MVDLILLGLKDFGIGEVSSINAYTRGILLTGDVTTTTLLRIFSSLNITADVQNRHLNKSVGNE